MYDLNSKRWEPCDKVHIAKGRAARDLAADSEEHSIQPTKSMPGKPNKAEVPKFCVDMDLERDMLSHYLEELLLKTACELQVQDIERQVAETSFHAEVERMRERCADAEEVEAVTDAEIAFWRSATTGQTPLTNVARDGGVTPVVRYPPPFVHRASSLDASAPEWVGTQAAGSPAPSKLGPSPAFPKPAFAQPMG